MRIALIRFLPSLCGLVGLTGWVLTGWVLPVAAQNTPRSTPRLMHVKDMALVNAGGLTTGGLTTGALNNSALNNSALNNDGLNTGALNNGQSGSGAAALVTQPMSIQRLVMPDMTQTVQASAPLLSAREQAPPVIGPLDVLKNPSQNFQRFLDQEPLRPKPIDPLEFFKVPGLDSSMKINVSSF
jgi:hypothetical protein